MSCWNFLTQPPLLAGPAGPQLPMRLRATDHISPHHPLKVRGQATIAHPVSRHRRGGTTVEVAQCGGGGAGGAETLELCSCAVRL